MLFSIIIYIISIEGWLSFGVVKGFLALFDNICKRVLLLMRWVGLVAGMGERRNLYRFLVGMPEGKRPLVRPRRRWEGGIKMDPREIS
jgi:hypothetical protein